VQELTKAAIGGLCLFCLVSAASLLGRTFWLFELLTHFRLQYAAAGVLLALVLAARRRWIGATIAAAVAVANGVPAVPYVASASAADAGSREIIRVMTLNLRHRFGDVDAVRNLVRAERPDVVLLTELLPAHQELLTSLDETLPHRVGTLPRSKFDAVLMSRLAIASSRIHYPAARFLPVIEARLCQELVDQESCLTVIALHSPRPDFSRGKLQNETFSLVGERAAAIADRRVIVMGDLNSTPYSHRFKDLARRGGLADAAIGAPWRTTWISRFPPFGLTLDHVLVGSAFRPVLRHVADDIGSDHFPLIVDVATDRVAPGRRERFTRR
jgi:endonuclease/exonuclease/phosphatase (EEP) superfamily protein YafD